MQKLRRSLRSGQPVIARDQPWIVVGTEEFTDATLVTLRGAGSANLGESARVLTPFDVVYTSRPRARLQRASRHAALAAAAASISDSPAWCDLWTAAAARIDLHGWQLEPARAVIAGASRLLLADAVGLGKTIQALLIVSELLARGWARRVLVLTPASLREQWKDEADRRFGLAATIFDQVSLAARSESLPAGVNPWSTVSFIVSSIDLVKRGDVRSALDQVPVDILIVDEAHHLTPGSDRGALVKDIAARTPWVALLTATPHTGDEGAFQFLRRLGDVDDEGGLETFRREPDDTSMRRPPRRSRLLAISPTTTERELFDETLAYARAVWQHTSDHAGAALVAAVIARRAASSPAAAQRTLERRVALIGQEKPHDSPQPLLPWDEGEREDEDLTDGLLAERGPFDRALEIDWLRRLARLASLAAVRSSKIAFVRRLLRRTTEPLIVFTEYRDVVEIIAASIADVTTVASLHGGLSSQERRHQLSRFTGGFVRTLIATDAAGEGLNLQARCRLVVNLELPWNPLRLEQRIGRVDRIGQTRRVHALHLLHRGSFEDVVRTRFAERQARASAATAMERDLITADVPAGCVRDRHTSATARDARALTSADALSTTRRLRSLAAPWPMRSPARRPCADSGRDGERTRAILLFSADIIDERQQFVERRIVCVSVDLVDAAASLSTVDLVARLAADRRVQATIEARLRSDVDAVGSLVARAAVARERRASSLLAAIARQTPGWTQTSLFDRREEQRSQLATAAAEAWKRNLGRHIDSARASQRLALALPQLVSAWIE